MPAPIARRDLGARTRSNEARRARAARRSGRATRWPTRSVPRAAAALFESVAASSDLISLAAELEEEQPRGDLNRSRLFRRAFPRNNAARNLSASGSLSTGCRNLRAVTIAISRLYLAGDANGGRTFAPGVGRLVVVANGDHPVRAVRESRKRPVAPRAGIQKRHEEVPAFALKNASEELAGASPGEPGTHLRADGDRGLGKAIGGVGTGGAATFGSSSRITSLRPTISGDCRASEAAEIELEIDAVGCCRPADRMDCAYPGICALQSDGGTRGRNRLRQRRAAAPALARDHSAGNTPHSGRRFDQAIVRQEIWLWLGPPESSGGNRSPFSRNAGNRDPAVGGSGFRAAITEQFGLPYLFGSGELIDGANTGPETGLGADCANFVVYALRRQGRPIPWSNPKQLRKHLESLRRECPRGRSAESATPIIADGLFVHLGSHVAAVMEDRPPLGVLDRGDLVAHQLEGVPEILSLGQFLAARKTEPLRSVARFRVIRKRSTCSRWATSCLAEPWERRSKRAPTHWPGFGPGSSGLLKS